MRKNIIIGNWKMNKTYKDSIKFVKLMDSKCKELNMEVGIAAPYLFLKDMKTESKNLIIASQNCYFKPQGAFTGEISIGMLKEINISHIIIGHSERRQIFNETDELINLKNKAILENGLVSIVCCGETLKQYENKETVKIVGDQIEKAYKNIGKELASKSIIAYEPIWAIGTGKTATSEIAQNVCKSIRNKLAKIYDEKTSQSIRIQYGGSVNAKNVKELLEQEDIDGALVGGASINTDSFLSLVKN